MRRRPVRDPRTFFLSFIMDSPYPPFQFANRCPPLFSEIGSWGNPEADGAMLISRDE